MWLLLRGEVEETSDDRGAAGRGDLRCALVALVDGAPGEP